MERYRTDEIQLELLRKVERAKYNCAVAERTNFKVADARAALSAASRELTEYATAARTLTEPERSHCAEHRIGVHAYVSARAKLSSDRLNRALRDNQNVVELAAAFENLAYETKEDLMHALEAAAAHVEAGFPSGTAGARQIVASIMEAAEALAIARDDDSQVGPLLEGLKTAMLERNASATRRAVEAVAKHFGLKLVARSTAPTSASTPNGRSLADLIRGVDIGIATQIRR